MDIGTLSEKELDMMIRRINTICLHELSRYQRSMGRLIVLDIKELVHKERRLDIEK